MKFRSIVLLLAMYSSQSFAGYGIVPSKFNLNPKKNPSILGGSLVYYGGPVISNVKIYTVIWGGGVNSEVQSKMNDFYGSYARSTQMDWANQYQTKINAVDGRRGTNQEIGRGSAGGTFQITPIHSGSTIDDRDVQAEIEAQVANHKLPAPDANTLYMIHFGPGITITVEGMRSCQSFCAYHSGFQSAKLGSTFYGVMPDLYSGACSFGCGFSSNSFESTTVVSSHEVMEAVTDPFPTPGSTPAFPQAWNTTSGDEIADLCTAGAGTLQTANGSYAVSKQWDNASTSCVGGPYVSQ